MLFCMCAGSARSVSCCYATYHLLFDPHAVLTCDLLAEYRDDRGSELGHRQLSEIRPVERGFHIKRGRVCRGARMISLTAARAREVERRCLPFHHGHDALHDGRIRAHATQQRRQMRGQSGTGQQMRRNSAQRAGKEATRAHTRVGRAFNEGIGAQAAERTQQNGSSANRQNPLDADARFSHV